MDFYYKILLESYPTLLQYKDYVRRQETYYQSLFWVDEYKRKSDKQIANDYYLIKTYAEEETDEYIDLT